MYDLCIVGCGMFGSAAARYASANPAVKVILIGPAETKKSDWSKREIFSSYYDEGRITRTLDEQIVCEVLSRHSIAKYRELEKMSGIKFHYPVGFLYAGQRNSSLMYQLKEAASFGKVPVVDLSSKDLKKKYPFLSFRSDDRAFLDENGAGHISPRRLVAIQQDVAERQGCAIIDDVVSNVSHLKKVNDEYVHEILTEKGQKICAKRVLIATGAYTNFRQLIPEIGNMKPDIKIFKDLVALLKISKSDVERLGPMPSIVYTRDDSVKVNVYILPPVYYLDDEYYLKIGRVDRPEDEVKTLEEIKEWYCSDGDPEITSHLTQIMKDMIPGLKVSEVKCVTCVTCNSPSKVPYIERVSPTVTVAIVGNGKGAKFSDEVGRIAAELAVNGKWDSELDQSLFNVVWTKSS